MSQQEGSSPIGAAPVPSLPPLDIEVRGVRVGSNKPCVITLAYRNSQFVVELLPESSMATPIFLQYGFDPGAFASKYPAGPGPLLGYNEPNSIESGYLQKLNAGMSEDGILSPAGFQTLYEIEDLIFAIGGQLFQDLAGPNPPDRSTTTLSEALNLQRFWLQMITVDGNASLIHRQEFTPPALSFEHQDVSSVQGKLPAFDISQIEILETIVPGRAYKVLADNRIRFCKVTGRGFEHSAIGRDCQMLQKIQDTRPAHSIRTPRLEGLVTTSQQSGTVIGFLTDYITPGSLLSTLGDLRDKMDQVSKLQREDWASQAKRIIEQLHGIGVVWGNVCPTNMLLDVEGNLWAVGFSGACTGGFRWGTILEFEKLSGDTKLEKCMEGKELQALEGEKGWAEIGKKDKDWVEVVVSPGMDKEKMEHEHGETEHVKRKRHKCDHESESTISLLTSFATSFIKKFPPN